MTDLAAPTVTVDEKIENNVEPTARNVPQKRFAGEFRASSTTNFSQAYGTLLTGQQPAATETDQKSAKSLNGDMVTITGQDFTAVILPDNGVLTTRMRVEQNGGGTRLLVGVEGGVVDLRFAAPGQHEVSARLTEPKCPPFPGQISDDKPYCFVTSQSASGGFSGIHYLRTNEQGTSGLTIKTQTFPVSFSNAETEGVAKARPAIVTFTTNGKSRAINGIEYLDAESLNSGAILVREVVSRTGNSGRVSSAVRLNLITEDGRPSQVPLFNGTNFNEAAAISPKGTSVILTNREGTRPDAIFDFDPVKGALVNPKLISPPTQSVPTDSVISPMEQSFRNQLSNEAKIVRVQFGKNAFTQAGDVTSNPIGIEKKDTLVGTAKIELTRTVDGKESTISINRAVEYRKDEKSGEYVFSRVLGEVKSNEGSFPGKIESQLSRNQSQETIYELADPTYGKFTFVRYQKSEFANEGTNIGVIKTRPDGSQTKLVNLETLFKHSKMLGIDNPTTSTFQIGSETGLAVMLFAGAKTNLLHAVEFKTGKLSDALDDLGK